MAIILATTGRQTGVEGVGMIEMQPTGHKSALLFCYSECILAKEIILRALHSPTLELSIWNTCKFQNNLKKSEEKDSYYF